MSSAWVGTVLPTAARVTIRAEPSALELMPLVEADLKAALRVQTFELSIGEPRDVVVEGYEVVST